MMNYDVIIARTQRCRCCVGGWFVRWCSFSFFFFFNLISPILRYEKVYFSQVFNGSAELKLKRTMQIINLVMTKIAYYIIQGRARACGGRGEMNSVIHSLLRCV